MKKMVTVVLLTVLSVCAAQAAPLDKSKIMIEANWAAHLDYDMLKESILGKAILDELAVRGVDQKLDNFAKIFSFHPIRDIHTITLFGQDKDPHKAVIIFEGTCNPETLVALVAMNEGYEKNVYGDYTIHRWFDEKKKGTRQIQFGCFYNPGTLLISMGKETLEQTLDVFNGKHPNAASKSMFKQFAEQDGAGVILSVFAENAGRAADGIEEAAILKQANNFSFLLGQRNNDTYIDVLLQATNSEEAIKIKQMVQGLTAFVSLSAGREHPQLNQLINAINVTNTDATVRLQFNWDSRDLITQMKTLEQMGKEKKNKQNQNTAEKGSDKS